MKTDPNARYAESHEWVRMEGNEAVVGITDHAQSQLSDLVYVELPPVGKNLKKGETFGVVESVKAASDLYMPMGGKIAAVNDALGGDPSAVNKDCYGAGWLIKFEPANPSEWDGLLSAADYEKEAAAH